MKKDKKIKKGFTILEVILAIFILSMGIFSSYSLIEQTIAGASLNKDRLIAHYLAQEGIENIRNIRDTNWLQGNDWKNGIPDNYQETVSFLDGTSNYFTRTTNVADKTDYLEVKVLVSWSSRRKEHSIETINHLYNWR